MTTCLPTRIKLEALQVLTHFGTDACRSTGGRRVGIEEVSALTEA